MRWRRRLAHHPLLLLDVDGPLNPHLAGPLDEFEVVRGAWGVWRLAPWHGERLLALADTFELVWATAWEDDANRYIAPALGLPELPMIRFSDVVGSTGTWKLATVRRYVGNRPVCWVDDELGADAHQWARRRRVPTMLMDVDPRVGLVEDDFRRIEDFGDALRRGRAA